jgi:hypothetical protein
MKERMVALKERMVAPKECTGVRKECMGAPKECTVHLYFSGLKLPGMAYIPRVLVFPLFFC